MRIAITAGGQEHIVEFDSQPSEADIEDAARQLGWKADAPAKQPAALKGSVAAPQPKPLNPLAPAGMHGVQLRPVASAAPRSVLSGFNPKKALGFDPATLPGAPVRPTILDEVRGVAAEAAKPKPIIQGPLKPAVFTTREEIAAGEKKRSAEPVTSADFAGLRFTYDAFQKGLNTGVVETADGKSLPIQAAQKIIYDRTGKVPTKGTKTASQVEQAQEGDAYSNFGKAGLGRTTGFGFQRQDVNEEGLKAKTTARLRQNANNLTEKVSAALVPMISANNIAGNLVDETIGRLFPQVKDATAKANELGAGLVGGVLTSPASLVADTATIFDPKESSDTRFGALANVGLAVAAPEAIVLKELAPTLKSMLRLASKGERQTSAYRAFLDAVEARDNPAAMKAGVELGLAPRQAKEVTEKVSKAWASKPIQYTDEPSKLATFGSEPTASAKPGQLAKADHIPPTEGAIKVSDKFNHPPPQEKISRATVKKSAGGYDFYYTPDTPNPYDVLGEVHAVKDGEWVGNLTVMKGPNGPEGHGGVSISHHRKGVATGLFDVADEGIGTPLVRSSEKQSAQMDAFWDNREKTKLEGSKVQSSKGETAGKGLMSSTPPEKFAASNAASNDLRAKAELGELPKTPTVRATAEEVATGFDEGATLSRARQVVQDVQKGKKAPVLSETEVKHMGMLEASVGKRLNAVKSELADAYANGKETFALEEKLKAAREDADAATLASKFVGTEQSRAFSARNQAYTEELTPAGQYREQTIAKKAPLTPEEATQAETLGKKLQEAQAELESYKKNAQEELAQTKIAEHRARTKRVGGGDVEAIRTRRADAVSRLKAKVETHQKEALGRANSIEGVASSVARTLSDIAPDVMEIVKTYAEEGVVKLADVVSKVRKDLDEAGIPTEDGDIERIIGGAYDRPKPTVSEARQQLNDLRKEARASAPAQSVRIKKSIRELEKRIASGEFPKAKPKPVVPKELQEIHIKLESLKVEAAAKRADLEAQARNAEMSPAHKALTEALNVPRSLVASTDLSAPLNQGAFAMYSHPVTSIRAMGKMIKAMKSEADYFRVLGEVRANPNYTKAVAGKLQIATDVGDPLDPGGELFLSKLLGAPLEVNAGRLGTIGLNPVASSERAYGAYLNKLRMDLFSSMVDKAERNWGPFKGKQLTLKDYKDIADWVNVSTGAGTGQIAQSLKTLNRHLPIQFAPSYMVSRWQLAVGAPALKAAITKNPKIAAMIVADYTRFVGAVGGILYAAKQSGADVEMDPQSSKFGKIQLPGGTLIDPFGGILAPLRVSAQAGLGVKNQETGGIAPADPIKTFSYYGGGKLSPIPRAGVNAIRKQAFGKSYDIQTEEGRANLAKSFLPISVQDQLDNETDKNLAPESKAALTILRLLGGQVQDPKNQG